MNEVKNRVIFLDIDGVILKHHGGSSSVLPFNPTTPLEGVKEKIDEWEIDGAQIILTTGRKESYREFTEKQLFESGIAYDMLIMGLGRGERIVINDRKPDGTEMARAINIDRNEGIGKIIL
jgi:hypothetical protein